MCRQEIVNGAEVAVEKAAFRTLWERSGRFQDKAF